MLDYGQEVYVYGREALKLLRRVTGSNQRKAEVAAKELGRYLDLMEKVLDQTNRRVLHDEKVPADQKVLSIFEDHTDIIAKGQRKAVFGHKVYVTTGRSSLILACRVEKGNPNDSTLFCPLLDLHIQTFGKAPAHASADGAFGSTANAEYASLKGVEAMCFGPLANDQTLRRELMHFRAGIEGVISALKRGVGLDRCDWRGWASFQSYVWAAVLAHNVKTIANTLQERKKAERRRNKKGRRNAA
jgi:IS5 family transposase